MRRILRIITFISGCFLLICAGCKHDPATSVTPTNHTAPPPGPSAGNWKISLLLHHSTDMTAHLAGYIFSFGSDGAMTVNTGMDIISGTWETTIDDDQPKFIIDLATTDEMLEELNEDWFIGTNTITEIELFISGSHTHTVHFTKL